jgi:hypothetical protein
MKCGDCGNVMTRRVFVLHWLTCPNLDSDSDVMDLTEDAD